MTGHNTSKKQHPTKRWQQEFSSIKEWQYFDGLTDPTNITHSKYFEFCSPLSTDKPTLHRRWANVILPIVENSQHQNLKQQYKRLQREWRDRAAIESFWAQIEDNELKETRKRNERKHRISLEGNAIDQLDSAFGYFSKKTKKAYAAEFFDSQDPFLVSGIAPVAEEEHRYTDLTAAEVEEEMDRDREEDKGQQDETQSSETDESYQPSRSPTITPTKQRVPWGVIYNTGEGVLDYPSSWRTPWVLDDVNVAELLWDFRQSVVAVLPNLDAPIESLALNHIYLIRESDNLSSLFSALGSALWSAVLPNVLQQRVKPQVLQDVFDVAFNIGNTSYVDARHWILQWPGDLDVKSLLTSMLGTSALWDSSRDNEAGLLKKRFDPFFSTFICPIKHLNVFWDMTFPPSKRRKSLDPGLRSQRPDFFVCATLPSRQCHLFTVEAKKTAQGLIVQSDLEKLACEMKDAIDDLAMQKIDISSVRVFGMLIVGLQADIYSMALEASGLYVMRSYTTVFAPRSHKDLGGLAMVINVFLNLKADIEESVRLCSRPLLPAVSPQICKSFGTPLKYKVMRGQE